MTLNEEKIKLAKELLKRNKNKKNKYAIILNLFKNEIKEALEEDLKITTIKQILEIALNVEIKESTFKSWFYRNLKPKKEIKNKTLNKKEENQSNNNDDVIDSFFAKAKKLTK